jgi:hypothetical protein
LIRQYLGNRKKGLNSKTDKSEKADIGFRAGDEGEADMDDEE